MTKIWALFYPAVRYLNKSLDLNLAKQDLNKVGRAARSKPKYIKSGLQLGYFFMGGVLRSKL